MYKRYCIILQEVLDSKIVILLLRVLKTAVSVVKFIPAFLLYIDIHIEKESRNIGIRYKMQRLYCTYSKDNSKDT
jgi:hypothetical protein